MQPSQLVFASRRKCSSEKNSWDGWVRGYPPPALILLLMYTYVCMSPLSSPQVRHAFLVMDLVPEQITDVLSVLAGILHLGNISFMSAAGAQISNKRCT